MRVLSLSILYFGPSVFSSLVDIAPNSVFDLDAKLFDFSSPVYSVLTDPRSSNWSTAIPSSVTEQQINRFLPVRIPMVKVIMGVNLADPVDLDNIEALLFAPKPIDLHLVPVLVAGDHANAILTRCYDTVVSDSPTRVRDFIAALADLASTRRFDGGFPVSPRSAILACRLFTLDLSGVNEWVDSDNWMDWDIASPTGLLPHTVTMNNHRFDNVSLETLGPILLKSQYEAWRNQIRSEL